ncbi:MAG: hypothetical protein CVU56_06020 [Deltaproteobacteria bacterium HGW-Deltaproteobacteria-14]|nr:MAG: hypothetical protein CVU56_06020 [Deltaproteobacteria bacterium HGW-Deltaproteobacteria-14]
MALGPRDRDPDPLAGERDELVAGHLLRRAQDDALVVRLEEELGSGVRTHGLDRLEGLEDDRALLRLAGGRRGLGRGRGRGRGGLGGLDGLGGDRRGWRGRCGRLPAGLRRAAGGEDVGRDDGDEEGVAAHGVAPSARCGTTTRGSTSPRSGRRQNAGKSGGGRWVAATD